MQRSCRFESDENAQSERFNAFVSPIESTDNIYEHAARANGTAPTPVEFDLRSRARPLRDQGPRGSCAAFTASAIKEVQENLVGEWMSPEFIYYHRCNKPADGMYGRNVFQILQRIGSVPESAYPYRGLGEEAPKPNKRLYDLAARYKIANFARVTTVEGLKRALVELGPCFLLLPQYKTRPEFWRATAGEHTSLSHAVTVVGYNKTGFILRNSWGEKWNGDGHVVFPYADWKHHFECWVSVEMVRQPPPPRTPECCAVI